MPVIWQTRWQRMSLVDSSLCSVSYQRTCNLRGSILVTESTSLRKHSAIRMLQTNVLPLLALPERPVSSPRAKQGLSWTRKRNSTGGSSLSGVIRHASSSFSRCSSSAEKPARASSRWSRLTAFWSIVIIHRILDNDALFSVFPLCSPWQIRLRLGKCNRIRRTNSCWNHRRSYEKWVGWVTSGRGLLLVRRGVG